MILRMASENLWGEEIGNGRKKKSGETISKYIFICFYDISFSVRLKSSVGNALALD